MGSVHVDRAPPVCEALCSALGRNAAFIPRLPFHIEEKNAGVLKRAHDKNALSAHWSSQGPPGAAGLSHSFCV